MEWAGTLSGVFGTLIALLALYLSRKDRSGDEMKALTSRVTSLETKMEPFWAAVQADMIKLLHHPWPERADMDALLDKLDAGTITLAERDELKDILTRIINADPVNPPPFPVDVTERYGAVWLLRSMDVVGGEGVAHEASESPEDRLLRLAREQVKRVERALRWYRYGFVAFAIIIGLLGWGFWQQHTDTRNTCIAGNAFRAADAANWDDVLQIVFGQATDPRAIKAKTAIAVAVHSRDKARAC